MYKKGINGVLKKYITVSSQRELAKRMLGH